MAYDFTEEELENARKWLANATRCHRLHDPGFAPCEKCQRPQVELPWVEENGSDE